MKSVNKVVTGVEQEEFGYWDLDKEEFVPVNVTSVGEMKAAAEALGCPEQLVDMLGMLFDSLKEAIVEDLTDIWERVK